MARDKHTVGSRLRELRKSMGLTQHDFASQFGMPVRTAQSYERDEVSPSGAFLAKLAAQNIDINELLTGHPYRRPIAKEPGTYTTIVTTSGKAPNQPGELDLEVLGPVLQSAIEEARVAKDINWSRTVQRFATLYARRFGELHGHR